MYIYSNINIYICIVIRTYIYIYIYVQLMESLIDKLWRCVFFHHLQTHPYWIQSIFVLVDILCMVLTDVAFSVHPCPPATWCHFVSGRSLTFSPITWLALQKPLAHLKPAGKLTGKLNDLGGRIKGVQSFFCLKSIHPKHVCIWNHRLFLCINILYSFGKPPLTSWYTWKDLICLDFSETSLVDAPVVDSRVHCR